MDLKSAMLGAGAGLLVGCIAAALTLSGTVGPTTARGVTEASGVAAVPVDARGAELGDDASEIGSIRVTVETAGANGAGTTNPIVIWFDNQGSRLSNDPLADFVQGSETTAVLSSHIPRTVGELRASSIVLTMSLERAAISASWKCARARLEVRLAGEEGYTTYLERDDVGWLSLDEPPRKSLAFALQ